jgi:predicted MPP superfamily phosphohydrolase
LFLGNERGEDMKNKKRIITKTWIIIFAFIAFGVLCFVYAHFEFNNIKIKEITIESPKIKGDGFRVMFISDFQFDTKAGTNTESLQNVIDTANQQEADLLLIGGDFVNYRRYQHEFYDIFKQLKIPRFGAFAVLGNHDYYSFDDNIEELESMGIKMLINDSAEISIDDELIQIAGVEDLWFGDPSFESAMQNVENEHFTFFLTHNPDFFVDELHASQRNQLDFTLAGHTHAGQVTFFGLLGTASIRSENTFTYRYGLRRLDGAPIYISSGVGGSAFGFFIRFFARPEIVMINVKS